ncbi:hypothetical protein L6164_017543 [Bauhinia variegata]|uniref:Uncharacterized protein n=1 Tax=Bauhinia variegata TaxID=167791 RepID=A0ACB9N9I7_BAUVA|nr:hypothetical protein L6164_017543 [Bauhinia variegata]
MNTFSHVPPGFRFHPTDEELVDYYLRKKITARRIDLDVIKDVDLYKIEPWDLQELCRIGTEEQHEWVLGLLVEVDVDNCYEEGWVVCRVFKKRITTMRKVSEHDSPIWYDDQVSFMQDLDSPKQSSQSNLVYQLPYPCKKELDLPYHVPRDHFLQLPLLESPKLLQSASAMTSNSMAAYVLDMNHVTALQPSSLLQEEQVQHTGQQNFQMVYGNNGNQQGADQVTDWRVLDKFVASQLSQEDVSKDNNYSNEGNIFQTTDNSNVQFRHLDKQEMVPENASTSTSNCPIDLWK